MSTRIYLVGAQCTGKTTLAGELAAHLQLPLINEVATQVMRERRQGIEDIRRLRTDLRAVAAFQREVFRRQLAAEQSQHDFVSDRSFDNLAYAAEHTTILPELILSLEFKSYVEWVKGGVVFFARPDRTLLGDGGGRPDAEWEAIVRIDGMVKLLLEMQADFDYVNLWGNPQERFRTATSVLRVRKAT